MSKKALSELSNRQRTDRIKLLKDNDDKEDEDQVPNNPRLLLPIEM